MKQYQEGLESILALDGLRGCALVDQVSGMVLGAAGPAGTPAMAEAAVDHWRLQHRPERLLAHGPVRAQITIHAEVRVTLTAGGAGFVLVCFSDEPDRVDWSAWKQRVGRLHASLRNV
jgi:hypothetical protein